MSDRSNAWQQQLDTGEYRTDAERMMETNVEANKSRAKTPEEILQLLMKAKFKRLSVGDDIAFPGVQSKKAAIAEISDDVVVIIDHSDFYDEWLMHVSFNDLLPERTFRLAEIT